MRFRLLLAAAVAVALAAAPALGQTVKSTYSGQVPQSGATAGKITVAASTNCSVLKADAAILYSITGIASANQVNYIRLYNLATTPTPGSSATAQMFGLIGGSAGAVLPNPIPSTGLAFPTGLAICVTGGAGGATDATAATAAGVVNYSFK